mmetsp:Transcript_12144/g.13844  ORF Transcript_12144/g.13844 Transcript_12144/m.13844 type:complete len:230 (-) Transcript_12144:47-736(-)
MQTLVDTDDLHNQAKLWLMIIMWRMQIISYGALSQWSLTVLVIVYFTIRSPTVHDQSMNFIKILICFFVSLTMFFNTQHTEGYYELKFKDIYFATKHFNIIVTPILMLLNHFGHSSIVFVLSQIRLVVLHSSQNKKQEFTKPNKSPTNQNPLPTHLKRTESCSQMTKEYYNQLYIYTYLALTLGVAIWVKFVCDGYIKRYMVRYSDIIVYRTLWLFYVFHNFMWFNSLA